MKTQSWILSRRADADRVWARLLFGHSAVVDPASFFFHDRMEGDTTFRVGERP